MLNLDKLSDDRFLVPQIIWNEHRPFKNRTFCIYDRDFKTRHVALNAAECIASDAYEHGPVYVYIGSLSQQKQFLEDLYTFMDEGEILAINGQTPDDEKKALFADIENVTRKYRVFTTTSCLTIGVDINTDHFVRAVGVFSRGCASIQQFIQGIHRPRRLKHVTLFIDQDLDKRVVYTTADIQNQAIIRREKLIWTDKLASYAMLYNSCLNMNPFSYAMEAFRQMGYKLHQEDLIDHNKPERRSRKAPKPLTIPNEPAIQEEQPEQYFMLYAYGAYLKSTLNHADVVDQYAAEYHFEDQEPTSE